MTTTTLSSARSSLLILATVFMSQQTGATTLGADALRALASGKTWVASATLSTSSGSIWNWQADGTLCLRLYPDSPKCDDDGTWKIADKRICYELTWWNKGYDLSSACFSVKKAGNGDYEATLENGISLIVFRKSP